VENGLFGQFILKNVQFLLLLSKSGMVCTFQNKSLNTNMWKFGF